MAQGRQTRIKSISTRKQLLPVGGRPLLVRTIGQVRARKHEPVVVGWPDMQRVVEQEYGCELITLTDPGDCILDGIFMTMGRWWRGRNYFLLGDVVYSNAAMDTIFGCKEDVAFFGTTDLHAAGGELFAYTMLGRSVAVTAELLLEVPCRQVNYQGVQQAGHLRNLLLQWQRHLGLTPKTQDYYAEELLVPIEDWTDDIDTDEQVQNLLPYLDRKVREERDAAVAV
jgi:hypothetical protein